MTTLHYIHDLVIPTAYYLLPAKMQSPEATAMLLAVGLQESKFLFREQVGGPAHGFWQFEKGGGVVGVLTHKATKTILTDLCNDVFRVPATPKAVYDAIVHNDILAAVCARLLLWTNPAHLPDHDESKHGWSVYQSTWRPGKPHPETWPAYFHTAWETVHAALVD